MVTRAAPPGVSHFLFHDAKKVQQQPCPPCYFGGDAKLGPDYRRELQMALFKSSTSYEEAPEDSAEDEGPFTDSSEEEGSQGS